MKCQRKRLRYRNPDVALLLINRQIFHEMRELSSKPKVTLNIHGLHCFEHWLSHALPLTRARIHEVRYFSVTNARLVKGYFTIDEQTRTIARMKTFWEQEWSKYFDTYEMELGDPYSLWKSSLS